MLLSNVNKIIIKVISYIQKSWKLISILDRDSPLQNLPFDCDCYGCSGKHVSDGSSLFQGGVLQRNYILINPSTSYCHGSYAYCSYLF